MSGLSELTDKEFDLFRTLIFKESGITLSDAKRGLLRSRLGGQLRKRDISSFTDYYSLVEQDRTGVELTRLIDSVSTNVTSFFREIKHFDFLNSTILPNLAAANKGGGKTIRVWSAASSSGEEPYSLLFTLLEHPNIQASWDIKLLATDISTEILRTAMRGAYPTDRLTTVPPSMLKKYFTTNGAADPDIRVVKPEIRQRVSFKKFNLMTPRFPFKHKFDFIFCRNVMIYFDVETRENLVRKFHDALSAGGYLLIGHSETLNRIDHRFTYVAPTIYQKTDKG